VLTPDSNDLLCFSPMCSPEKVSELIYCPVICLFGTRVGFIFSSEFEDGYDLEDEADVLTSKGIKKNRVVHR
jgi:hypothetical protein